MPDTLQHGGSEVRHKNIKIDPNIIYLENPNSVFNQLLYLRIVALDLVGNQIRKRLFRKRRVLVHIWVALFVHIERDFASLLWKIAKLNHLEKVLLHRLPNLQSSLRIQRQAFLDEIFQVDILDFIAVVLATQYFFVSCRNTCRLEWRRFCNQLICQAPQTPNIRLKIMAVSY